MANFQPQRLHQHGWADLGNVDTLDRAVKIIDEDDERREENGDSKLIGWVTASTTGMAVHSRKDGRFRIIETSTEEPGS